MLDEVATTVQPLVEQERQPARAGCCAADLGAMHADVTKVRQVLFNLLTNASKFTEKGTISPRGGARRPPSDLVRFASATPASA